MANARDPNPRYCRGALHFAAALRPLRLCERPFSETRETATRFKIIENILQHFKAYFVGKAMQDKTHKNRITGLFFCKRNIYTLISVRYIVKSSAISFKLIAHFFGNIHAGNMTGISDLFMH